MIAPDSVTHRPFCPERVESVTPPFPNLHPHARYSSVAVFSPRGHLLPLAEITPTLVADNLSAHIEFVRTVTQADHQSDSGAVIPAQDRPERMLAAERVHDR
jgi:hypothetical protein